MSMYSVVNTPLNETAANGLYDDALGVTKEHTDVLISNGTQTVRTQIPVSARWVKNRRGSALTLGLCVKDKATYAGVGVDICGAGEICTGVTPPHISSTADLRNLWVITRGPALLTSDGAGTIAEGDIVVTAANGKTVKQTVAPANETAVMVQVKSVVGIAMAAVAATDGATYRAMITLPYAP
jgi:hypothetical protein